MFNQQLGTLMTLDPAIQQHRDALIRIVLTLFAMLGLRDGVDLGRIPRKLKNTVHFILLPAESAVRRLIVAAAKGLVAKPQTYKPMAKGTKIPKGTGKRGKRAPLFKLSDQHEPWLPPPSKRKKRPKGPRIRGFGPAEPTIAAIFAYHASMAKPEQKPKRERKPGDGRVDGARLQRRLQAIMRALRNIPKEAQRYVQWQARREMQADAGRRVHTSPFREGEAPGYRHPFQHEVHEILDESIWLAGEAMRAAKKIDSS
jgi:hypothetical protein